MSLIEYSPKATAHAVRCKPDTLRDWRRLGLFERLGERKGKGHKFTLSDVARIALAAFLARNGASLREAFEIVTDRGPIVDTIAATVRNQSDVSKDYHLTFVINPDVSFPESITGAPVNRIEFDSDPIGALQINVSKLIRSALERLTTIERIEAMEAGFGSHER